MEERGVIMQVSRYDRKIYVWEKRKKKKGSKYGGKGMYIV